MKCEGTAHVTRAPLELLTATEQLLFLLFVSAISSPLQQRAWLGLRPCMCRLHRMRDVVCTFATAPLPHIAEQGRACCRAAHILDTACFSRLHSAICFSSSAFASFHAFPAFRRCYFGNLNFGIASPLTPTIHLMKVILTPDVHMLAQRIKLCFVMCVRFLRIALQSLLLLP